MSIVIGDELVGEALARVGGVGGGVVGGVVGGVGGGVGGGGVVALETAVLTHGLPYPLNVETVLAMKAAVVAVGALPAVVGVLDGKLVVGLGDAEIERLGAGAEGVLKLSARDLAGALATGGSGGTTVAGTLVACRLAGIRVFATGGIGGVQRGWSVEGVPGCLDISADLAELARTGCAVVCSGAKSILDVGATLEMLETQGVPVLGYGVDVFPQFYSLGDGALRVPRRVAAVEEVVRICGVHWGELGMGSGVLVAQPVPSAVAIEHAEMELLIAEAVREVREAGEVGVVGNALTPFLLGRLAAGNGALAANVALLKANAELAGRLAVCAAADS